MKNMAQEADRITKQLGGRSIVLESLRDSVDIRTGGDLDCTELDLLTNMVEQRLKRAATTQIEGQ